MFNIETPMALSEKTTTACTGALYDNLRKPFRHEMFVAFHVPQFHRPENFKLS
jgi:hypothetical protein